MAALWGDISLLVLAAIEHWTPRGMLHGPLHKVSRPLRLLLQKHPHVFCFLQSVNRASAQADSHLVWYFFF